MPHKKNASNSSSNSKNSSSSNPLPPPNSKQRKILKWGLMTATVLMLIAGATALCLFMAPYDPPEFQLNSVLVSSFDLSNPQSNTNWNIGISLRNPNSHTDISYHQMKVTVLSRDQPIWEGSQSMSLVQSSKAKNSMQVDFEAAAAAVDAEVMVDISKSMEESKTLYTDLWTESEVEYNRLHVFKTKTTHAAVICKDVMLKFSQDLSSGTMDGIPRLCLQSN